MQWDTPESRALVEAQMMESFGDRRVFMTRRTTDKQFEAVMKLCLRKQILEHGELDLET